MGVSKTIFAVLIIVYAIAGTKATSNENQSYKWNLIKYKLKHF